MLGADGARLAKRHGAVTLADRAAAGESPAEVRAALARSVGLAAAGEPPTLHELLRPLRSIRPANRTDGAHLMDLNQLFVPIAIGALVIVAVIAIVFNPSIMGIGFALIVIVGACTVWLLRQLYLAESDEDDR